MLSINLRRTCTKSVDHFVSRPSDFSSFFRRVLALVLDRAIQDRIRAHLLVFVISAYQSLDNGLVRKECAPLVSIATWHNLHSDDAREHHLNRNVSLRKAWRAAKKRYEAADDDTKSRLLFERSWLASLMLDFLNKSYTKAADEDRLLYCERVMELLSDLQSQLPTRRYVNTLVQDLLIIPAISLSPLYEDRESGLFRDLLSLLRHYTFFPIDDVSGRSLSDSECHKARCARLTQLQRIAIKHFKEKLTILALSNNASLTQRSELEIHLRSLDVAELIQLNTKLGLRTTFPASCVVTQDRQFFIEAILSVVESRPTFREVLRDIPTVPTEKILYETTFLRNETYNGTEPLAIPKLNLQYLTNGDFLWRSFILYRCESFYEIRKHLEETIKRMRPSAMDNKVIFDGASKMAIPIEKPAIIDVVPPRVGETYPTHVRAEVILNVERMNYSVRREWETLKPNDVVFLLAIQPPSSMMNGHTDISAEMHGLVHLRVAEVVQVQDENGRFLRDRQEEMNGGFRRVQQRRLILNLDTASFYRDTREHKDAKSDVYGSINLIVRRRGRENNFKPILESIRHLTLSDAPAPSWLQGVFLGYGDPAGATYKNLSNRLRSIDFWDTFLNWQHLAESFSGSIIKKASDQADSGPPFVVETIDSQKDADQPPKKRRRDEVEAEEGPETLKISTYKPVNMGPYPVDAPKVNKIHFTPAQAKAIISGTQPGLTVIVGPPGTGKTDVATQIINNIYHNFSTQRTLLIARSNQALNQLFQKIVALDIDERHLLRLGHGEEDLETEGSYSKHGRVVSFLENGAQYLAEVNRLATNLGAPGAHGSSCETADYFNVVYVKPAWQQYWDEVNSADSTMEEIIEKFPFLSFFSDAPQPIFRSSSRDELLEAARGCYRHIEKIFSELEDIRPFEILRNPREKANYLLIKEARIIAMTSTHAAMRRQEIANLGFHYDNVVVEEAAQITEIESFIPLALQKPKGDDIPLQRVILCGDHLQNSPIVQNLAFRQYANLEQSLFLRLIRLGVPTIDLDRQGRARPSIAQLYRWRYPGLGNLPVVENSPEFKLANAGLRYDYQFINVPDYRGQGEREPSPHFIQNLGEAEYAVAVFMFLRLLGFPASKVTILTTYSGQRALIKDVLAHRCAKNRLFGLPRMVTTVDKYQGEQNDCK